MNTFILSLFSKEDKLKPKTLYQILIGRRTSSTLSYAFFYDLLFVFGVFPELQEDEFNKRLTYLVSKQFLYVDSQGLIHFNQNVPSGELLDFSGIDFFSYGRKAQEAWRSALFLIQVASFLGRESSYDPLEHSPTYTEPVRHFVRKHRETLRTSMGEELPILFSGIPEELANLIGRSLTGYNHNGQAFHQLLTKDHSWVTSVKIQHLFFQAIERSNGLMAEFMAPILQQNWNRSMLQTKDLLQMGDTLEQIAKKRNLKLSTVQDHVVEWAIIDPTFPFTYFLALDDEWPLLSEPVWNVPYKDLVELTGRSFLEIRLYQIWRKHQS